MGASEEARTWGPIKILGNSVEPGQKQRLMVSIVKSTVEESIDKRQLEFPAFVARGVRRGPTLGVTGGIHGDELNGVEVARRVVLAAQPDKMAGTLIVLPGINVPGIRNMSRYLPDRRDLNRSFPGSRRGSLASILADAAFRRVIRRCDRLIDLHTASNNRINLPQIRTDLNNSEALDLARSFDAGIVIHGMGPPGSLRGAAMRAGIPAVLYEAGEPLRFGLKDIEVGVEGVQRVMAHLGMTDYRPPTREKSEVFFKTRWVRVKKGWGGMFFPSRGPGDLVRKGEELGLVVEPWTDTKRKIVAPVDGRIIGMAVPQFVLSGYGLFHIGLYT